MFGFGLRLGIQSTASGGGGGIVVPNLPQWSAALTAMRAGTRNAILAMEGDSTTAGHSAFAAGMNGGAKAGSVPSQLGYKINRRGLDFASWSSVVSNNNGADTRIYDFRVSFPPSQGWGFGSGTSEQTPGGFTTKAETYSPPSKYTFSPLNQCDTFELLNPRHTTSATAAWLPSFNGGADGTAISNYNASGSFTKDTVTTTLGRNSFAVKAFDTSATYFTGMIAYNSTIKEITILNMGWSGGTTADWATNTTAWSPSAAAVASVLAPDLVTINIGINDQNSASPTAQGTFEARVGARVDYWKAGGADVAIVIPNPIGGTYTANGNIYAGYLINVANAKNVPYIDLRVPLVDYTTANAAGLMADTLHPNANGYSVIADYIMQTIYPTSVFPAYTDPILFEDTATFEPTTGASMFGRLTADGLHWSPSGGGSSYLYPALFSATNTAYFSHTNANGQSLWYGGYFDGDVEVELVINTKSVITGELFGPVLGCNPLGTTGVHGRYNNGNWQLLNFGVGQIGADVPVTLTPGNNTTMTLRRVGTTGTLLINGVSVASGTVTGQKGWYGIRYFPGSGGAASATTGNHIVSFKATDI